MPRSAATLLTHENAKSWVIGSVLLASVAAHQWPVTNAIPMAVGAASETEDAGFDIDLSPLSGPVEGPKRHFRIRNPAPLTPAEAEQIYSLIRGALGKGYRLSELSVGREYQNWQRYNTAPYMSVTHGNHYLNNYANSTAVRYGQFEEAGKFPVGSVLAKDSFTMTESHGIVLGSLFVMEKMSPGFNYVTGDWRFTQILPDGTFLGETNGRQSERVEYCIGCHLAVQKHDYLYFIPPEYRTGATTQ